jgi:hypothetical protein
MLTLDNLRQDLRYAWRSYMKAPAFTLLVVTTLALGIGASTAIFSIVNGILLKPLPFPDPDRLMFITEQNKAGAGMSVSWMNSLDWRARQHSFYHLALSRHSPFTLTGVGQAVRVTGRRVTGNFFQAVGVQPSMGRGFADDDDKAGAAAMAPSPTTCRIGCSFASKARRRISAVVPTAAMRPAWNQTASAHGRAAVPVKTRALTMTRSGAGAGCTREVTATARAAPAKKRSISE